MGSRPIGGCSIIPNQNCYFFWSKMAKLYLVTHIALSWPSASAFKLSKLSFSSISIRETKLYLGSLWSTQQVLSYGEGMDQADMMENDRIVAVDCLDRVIPNENLHELFGSDNSSKIQYLSKKIAHTFTAKQPRGIAHRAFSVFIFNKDDQMLLTKRAPTKITFPNVWTNACCSHPIYGMNPDEVDDGEKDYPAFPGIKFAAVRKLYHELGISPKYVPHKDFRFITRFHYWAADTVTYGVDEPKWGEHEIDYVLFIKLSGNELPIEPNAEEVADYKFVTKKELQRMFYQDVDKLWSPWFRGIMDRGGFEWWDSLDEIISAESEELCRFTNPKITFFSPPIEHHAVFNAINEKENQHIGVLSN